MQSTSVHGKLIVPDDVKKSLCMKDKDCRKLLEALYHEARSEPDEGVIAVAAVIKNRASHPKRWKNTIYGVITEKHQFSYLTDGSVERGMKDKSQVNRLGIIAYDVIHGKIESSLVKDALFYHTVGMKKYPHWSKKKKVVKRIHNHIFYTF